MILLNHQQSIYSNNVLAPKTVDRLEKLVKLVEQRKLEEEEENEEDKLTIHGDSSLKLDALDINDIGDKLKLKNEIIHDIIELK